MPKVEKSDDDRLKAKVNDVFERYLRQKMSRRRAISASAKVAVGTAAGLVVGGGVASAIWSQINTAPPAKTSTVTETMTVTGGSSTSSASSSLTAQQGVTINFLVMDGPRFAQPVKAVVPDFQNATGINVNVVTGPYSDVQQKIAVELAAQSSTYDLVWMDYEYQGTYMANKWLYPLDNYLQQNPPEGYPNDFYPRIFGENRYPIDTGTWYSLTVDLNMQMQDYRQDVMTQNGLSAPASNWDDALAIAAKLHNPPTRYGLVADWYKLGFAIGYFWGVFEGYGGVTYDPNTFQPGFDTDAGRNAFALMQKIYSYAPKDAVNWTEDQTFQAWTKDTVAYNPDEWGFSSYQNPDLDPYANNTLTAITPMVTSTTKAVDQPWNNTPGMVSVMGGYGLGIPLKSSHPYEAYTFINWYLSKGLPKATENTAQPPRKSVIQTYYKQNPVKFQFFDTFDKLEEKANVRPIIPEALEMDAIIGTEVVNVLSGQYDAETGLKNMDANILQSFKKSGRISG